MGPVTMLSRSISPIHAVNPSHHCVLWCVTVTLQMLTTVMVCHSAPLYFMVRNTEVTLQMKFSATVCHGTPLSTEHYVLWSVTLQM